MKGSESGLISDSIWEDLWTVKKWLSQGIGKISARYQSSYPKPRPSLAPSIRNRTCLLISPTQEDRLCGIEGRARNQCWSVKEVLHILSGCLQPCLSSRQTHAPCEIVICGQSDSTIFFPNYLINDTVFGK